MSIILHAVSVVELDFLQAQGCEAFQGYLMGKPMPLDEFEGTVRQCRAGNSKKQLATLPG